MKQYERWVQTTRKTVFMSSLLLFVVPGPGVSPKDSFYWTGALSIAIVIYGVSVRIDDHDFPGAI